MDCVGGRHLRALWPRPYRGMAPRGHLSLSQRFRFDRAVLHEDSRAQGAGPHTIRTAVSRDASRGHSGAVFIVLGILAAERFPGEAVRAA